MPDHERFDIIIDIHDYYNFSYWNATDKEEFRMIYDAYLGYINDSYLELYGVVGTQHPDYEFDWFLDEYYRHIENRTEIYTNSVMEFMHILMTNYYQFTVA